MKNFIRTIKSVLLCTLIVVCVCSCGKNTATYISSEEKTLEETQQTDTMENSALSSNAVIEENSHAHKNSADADEKKESDLKTDTEGTLLYLYVCGAVNQPGVYTLPLGSRVCDLFEAAGGLREDAATDYWNQASVLSDGEMFYVPTIEEAKERQNSGLQDSTQATTTNDNSGKVNLNTASLNELMEIPGIGESKAKAILSYREEHGGFSSLEEIMNIEGIKEGVFSKMKEYIVIN